MTATNPQNPARQAPAIRKVAVIGAGVMGAGIAAHFANAGCAVTLLDVAAEGPDPAKTARDAAARQLKTGGFMHPSFAERVSFGSIDDLSPVADCDWVIEAVIERLDVKRALYARLDQAMKPDAALSSNTSTIPLATLTGDMPAARARRFFITHFFNPPRHMRLLEVVAGPDADPEALARVAAFADYGLGKSVTPCKDTPGFLANRIGCVWMLAAIRYAVELGLTVEEADAALSKPFGIPATGVFGLTDLVGVDLMPKVWGSYADALPPGDLFHQLSGPPSVIDALVARGDVGRKAGAGFYRKIKAGPAKGATEALDLITHNYRPQTAPTLESLRSADPRALMTHPDRGGRYAWMVMSATLAYAAALIPEISDDIAPVDEAMRLGYNWKAGPFELIDRVGAGWLTDQIRAQGGEPPSLLVKAAQAGGFYQETSAGVAALTPAGTRTLIRPPPGVIRIADLRRAGKKTQGNAAGSLWDMGDGVACLELHRKMNAMAPESLDAIEAATARVRQDFRALVIGGDGGAFCAGADLSVFVKALESGDVAFLDDFVRRGQRIYAGLKYAPFPVAAAVAGAALGGGCELLLHCDHTQAHAESAVGLVERNVGLIPAWGGCLHALIRAADDKRLPKGPLPAPKAAFETIVAAAVSTSAAHARDLRFLRPDDGVTMNRDRLLADAKAQALALADAGYQPPQPREFRLPGPSGRATLVNLAETLVPLGALKGHDLTVAKVLADVLTGGPSADPLRPTTEADVLDLERQGFLELAGTAATAARVAHMLATGKPLKN